MDALAHNLVVYENGNSGITIGSGTTGTGSLYFGDGIGGDAAYKGSIESVHGSTNELRFRANSVIKLVLDPDSRISLSNNDSGTSNTIFGKNAGLAGLSGGTHNVLVGEDAGNDMTTADHNTAVGYQSMDLITTLADGNTAVGYQSLHGNITTQNIDNCVAIGKQTLNGALTADADGTVAVGMKALYALTDGAQNVAVGYQSLSGCTTGKRNTALGYQSIYSNMNVGDANTAVGFSSLYSLNPSSDDDGYNTAQGAFSGYYITTGQHNTMLGYATASTGSINLTTGSGNTFIGSLAQASAVGVSDEIILKAGTDAVSGAGTETIKIGVDSDFITNDFGENATWTHSSDKRIKKDIKDNTLGLDFINDLRTVTFKKKAPSEYPKEFDSYNETKTERKSPDRVNYGFIAQEVKASMDKSGHSKFPVWKENTDTMQELGETELITPLVKAIQELTAKVKELEAKLK